MIDASDYSERDKDMAFMPSPLRGKDRPKTMRTSGMGAMLGAPRPTGLMAPVGKIEKRATPYETEKPQKMAKGGSVSASSRADGCALRGKTKGKIL